MTDTLCTCGHAEGYHDARSLETDDQVEVCSVWACYCTGYEVAG